MPKIVDHDARRREIVEACLRVVSRAGLAAATTREIASEAGVSHGIIAHYFTGKDEILRAALQRSYEQLAERIDLDVSGLSGVTALHRAAHDALPIGEEDRTGEQIELAFWGYAMGDPEL
ncbi:MAG: TetR family transcriptional regulator, partial [Cellulomonadaceae bacterium]